MSAAASIHARIRVAHPGFTLDVDLALPGRGVTALFGHSGSGKTTCLRAFAGLEPAASGFLSVNGETWLDSGRRHRVPVHRRALGYVFQEASLFPHLSVYQNLEYGRRRRPPAPAAPSADIADLTGLLGIGHLLDRRPQTLSGGERQRVAIARALLASPRLLLMDEPLAALDHARKAEILPYLERLRDALDIPVIYVSHSPDEVIRLADHLVLLSGGRVAASGPLASTLARLDLPPGFFDDASVVIDGTVVAHDPDYHFSTVAFPGGELRITRPSPDVPGRALRIRIKAGDVSLALQPPDGTTIANSLPARIVEQIPAADPGHVLLSLDLGAGTRLSARITRHSRDRLGLAPGRQVWAQVKAVAVLV
ncbi:molybdenum ABC transporter ATP-binding protein [Termitidicoccus mucosus]|uniref:Molybdenum ABC transporter ATP-binding protein n=1 Tax=Termitidicoccus mucosus TaxID=1184151 RepID=A0A178INC5_9BACT|nr:molybdenum ABC transporter ATP-binding protein [Opitutaceae bacterium TSB47]